MPLNPRPLSVTNHAVIAACLATLLLLVLLAGVDRKSADAAPTAAAASADAAAATTKPARTAKSRPTTTTATTTPETTTTVPETTTTVAPPAVRTMAAITAEIPPPLAPRRGGIPVGKGMWIWLPERAEGGDPAAIVARAQAAGLTHIYVRTGSSRQGFYGGPFLDAILPAAHAAGIRVYGWDFPYLNDVQDDINRSMQAILYQTPAGHRIDGFVPDIESSAEGTNLTVEAATAYSAGLRNWVGPDYPLVVCVPRPSEHTIGFFPYAQLMPYYDAVAPMVYWLNRQPDSDVTGAIQWLSQFGKPVIPVGQAYDGGPEGGRPGAPSADEIFRFLGAAEAAGASGASFWSWQHATPEIWNAIAASGEITLPPPGAPLNTPEVLAVQSQLGSLGYPVPVSGAWDQPTIDAVRVLQTDLGATPTGELDGTARAALLGPLAPPVGAR